MAKVQEAFDNRRCNIISHNNSFAAQNTHCMANKLAGFKNGLANNDSCKQFVNGFYNGLNRFIFPPRKKLQFIWYASQGNEFFYLLLVEFTFMLIKISRQAKEETFFTNTQLKQQYFYTFLLVMSKNSIYLKRNTQKSHKCCRSKKKDHFHMFRLNTISIKWFQILPLFFFSICFFHSFSKAHWMIYMEFYVFPFFLQIKIITTITKSRANSIDKLIKIHLSSLFS